MATTFFQMRDELEQRIQTADENPEKSDASRIHIFRYLMMNAIYNKNSPAFGMVSRKNCSVEVISRGCLYSEATVKRALKDLEEAGWIKRLPRTSSYGKIPSDICLSWVRG